MKRRRRINPTNPAGTAGPAGKTREGQRIDRLQFYLEPALNRELDRLSAECNVSKAELIRDGVRHIVEEYQAVEDDPLFDIVGAAKSKTADASEQHDRYLYGSA